MLQLPDGSVHEPLSKVCKLVLLEGLIDATDHEVSVDVADPLFAHTVGPVLVLCLNHLLVLVELEEVILVAEHELHPVIFLVNLLLFLLGYDHFAMHVGALLADELSANFRLILVVYFAILVDEVDIDIVFISCGPSSLLSQNFPSVSELFLDH